MRAELPFLAAGAVSVAGGVARERKWPSGGMVAVISTGFIVLVAAASNGSKVAPLVRAIGLLVLLGAVMGAVPFFHVVPKRTIKKGK